MNKDRLKSVILIILIVFNLVLAERILVDKRLWPSGYNLFNFGASFKKSSGSPSEALIFPERIIVNTGYQSSRFEYNRSMAEFDSTFEKAKSVITAALSKPLRELSVISPDDWYRALTRKSVYLSYPCKFSLQNYSALLGLSTEFTLQGFSDIVISENGTVYISDTADNTFYKIDTTSTDMADIVNGDFSEKADSTVINYSFDLNFDKDFGDQKTILSPMIPVYSAPVEAEVIQASNPVFKEDSSINNKAVSGILDAFSINPGTVWRYTEADGSLVFVENTGILKISPDGLLTFSATSGGIRLSGNFASSAAPDVAKLVSEVNSGAGCNADMYITSPLTTEVCTEFTLDYMVDGIPVRFNGINAVHVTVRDGYITEYAQILRRYTPCGYKEYSPLYIETLDNIIAKYSGSMNHINIIKMFPAYIDNLEQDRKTPDWFVEIDNVVAE